MVYLKQVARGEKNNLHDSIKLVTQMKDTDPKLEGSDWIWCKQKWNEWPKESPSRLTQGSIQERGKGRKEKPTQKAN